MLKFINSAKVWTVLKRCCPLSSQNKLPFMILSNPKANCQQGPNPPEFAQPRLSRSKRHRSNTPKFVASRRGNTSHLGTNTPKFVPFYSNRAVQIRVGLKLAEPWSSDPCFFLEKTTPWSSFPCFFDFLGFLAFHGVPWVFRVLFHSDPGILGVRKRRTILVFLWVFLAFSQKNL